MGILKRAPLLLALLVVSGVFAACDSSNSSPDANSPDVLTVMAGSEVKDIEPLLADLRAATGVQLVMSYTGTLDGAEAIDDGAATDIAWFSNGHYLSLLPKAGKRIVAQTKVMLSPVIIGVKQSVAQKFGWVNNPNVTWRDIEAKAADGSFHFAMTNPAASNSGLCALIGVASALSGSSDAIDAGTIDQSALTSFFKGQTLTAGSSGFLADSYVRQQDSVDGIVNYESILMSLNDGGKLHEPMTLIYPKEGIITADYPFMLLNGAKRNAYDKVVAWLTLPDTQKRIMSTTLRRPSVPGVAPATRFPTGLIELPYPSRLETINSLITTYLDKIRKPASAIFVLDLSGSMAGDRLDSLKKSLTQLTGLDTSLTGTFSRFRARETITFITFSTTVLDSRDFTIDDTDPNGRDMTAIRDYVDSLTTYNSTAIYGALERAYSTAQSKIAGDPNRLYSIVLMTDGDNNSGVDSAGFASYYAGLSANVQAVKVFPILFGEGNVADMKTLATLTGGTTFDAKSNSLETIFKQIRGYQ